MAQTTVSRTRDAEAAAHSMESCAELDKSLRGGVAPWTPSGREDGAVGSTREGGGLPARHHR